MNLKKFLKKFEDNYKEVVALLNGIEDEQGAKRVAELKAEDINKTIQQTVEIVEYQAKFIKIKIKFNVYIWE